MAIILLLQEALVFEPSWRPVGSLLTTHRHLQRAIEELWHGADFRERFTTIASISDLLLRQGLHVLDSLHPDTSATKANVSAVRPQSSRDISDAKMLADMPAMAIIANDWFLQLIFIPIHWVCRSFRHPRQEGAVLIV